SRYVVRANKLWSTYRNSPLKYHFRAVCEMASTRIVDDLRAKFGKSTSVNFLVLVALFRDFLPQVVLMAHKFVAQA
ncbi:hypothetical protein Q604_UNBC08763G0001, partial [human gut metagenome]